MAGKILESWNWKGGGKGEVWMERKVLKWKEEHLSTTKASEKAREYIRRDMGGEVGGEKNMSAEAKDREKAGDS
ncbi:hypothetical protein HPP92_019227 [Vanilla planifolia]|uniref:Uncharacterized protein n=1 Tax=Vanilla planifolia TaxID=51239 RepID=A0A835UN06_VANPL|nr:hypothetical protein HPP92_019227 [Vanilla planifolia]